MTFIPFIFSLILPLSILNAHLISTGTFFKKVKGQSEGTTIDPEFFKCGRSSGCFYVGKKVVANQISRTDEDVPKNHDEIWRKMTYKFKDCKDIYDYGQRRSGEYYINPMNNNVLKVYCSMESYGGGWTVIQRRVDNKTNFQRNWYDYQYGFGELTGNLWIGLENMHALARPGKGAVLRIELKHLREKDTTYHANYCSFAISAKSEWYRLEAEGYWGNAGDGFSLGEGRKNNGMKFSTMDVDNDENIKENCASKYKGGWWYNRCHSCQLNALYPNTYVGDNPTYMSWLPLGSEYGNIFFSEMKITRDNNYFRAECAKLVNIHPSENNEK